MTDNRAILLEHALPLVPFDGWSDYMFDQASKRAGLSAAEVKQAFPGGASACIDYFFAQEDEKLAQAFPESLLAAKRVPERIEMLLMAKLELFALHKEVVRRAVAQKILPWKTLTTVQSVYKTVDKIWRLAGDKSLDFNFYTKRLTLAGVYVSTLLYWLNDESENLDKTREFLKNRLSDVATFGKKKKAFLDKFRPA